MSYSPLKFHSPVKLLPYCVIQICLLLLFFTPGSMNPWVTNTKTKTRLERLRVDFIFSREGLMEENRVTSLNEHADSLEKVTTVKRVARPFGDLTAQLTCRDKRNRSLVHRPMCLNCRWLKIVGCYYSVLFVYSKHSGRSGEIFLRRWQHNPVIVPVVGDAWKFAENVR